MIELYDNIHSSNDYKIKYLSRDNFLDSGTFEFKNFNASIFFETLLATEDGKKNWFKKVFSFPTIYDGFYHGLRKLTMEEEKIMRKLWTGIYPVRIYERSNFLQKYYLN